MRKYIVLLAVFTFISACGKDDDGSSQYADVFDEYEYRDIGYDDIVNRESEYAIVIGDLQYCTVQSQNIESLRIIIDWIRSQIRSGVNIRGILQTGDMTQSNSTPQWRIYNSHTVQLRMDVPTFMCTGNHDYKSFLGLNISDRYSTLYNDYIDYAQEAAEIVEVMKEGRQENALLTLDIAGETLYILSLEYSPRFEVTLWGQSMLDKYAGKPFILLTHDYLDGAGNLTNELDDQWHQNNDQGEGLWEKLVKPNDEIRTVLCGHNVFTARRVSGNDVGNTVTQIMFNPQDKPRGGDGWIQIWEFDPDDEGLVDVLTYNIYRKQTDNSQSASFSFRYK